MSDYSLKHQFDFKNGEVFLINKPYKFTSFKVVKIIRFNIKQYAGIKKIKIGHAGTLDPLATGLLILCTGKFTKRIEEFQGLEKEYTGTFTLGSTTPSYDLETEINQTYDISNINAELLYSATKQFTGTFEQTPPIFSAIKIKGKRAYEYARDDEYIKIKPKKVTIHKFELTKIDLPEVEFKVVCSKGTYIRSLAYDFGKTLNCGAHLSSLCRTRIGKYKLSEAYEIDELENKIISSC
ncbi:MAG: tRNA pseudouridine(55) synthase TruB [Bacteroidales bacterium]|nr:tRNA pseudouridine(55) synthase TruB [Bacteroidales bacterium]